jgi:hypothetical protein
MKKRLIQIGLFFGFFFLGCTSILFGNCNGFDQDTSKQPALHVSTQSSYTLGLVNGFLLPHHEDMQQMYAHISGFQFQMLATDKSRMSGNEHISQRLGYLLTYYDLGSQVNGKAFSAALLVSSDVFNWQSVKRPSKYINGSFKFALGLGYLTQKYDAQLNPENRAIGSYINGFMQLGLSVEAHVFSKAKVFAEFGMSHFSNACWQFPNLGINLPYIQYGMGIDLYRKVDFKPKQQLQLPLWKKTLSLRMGKKEIDLDDDRIFYNALAEFTFERYINAQSNLRYSLSYFYDRTYQFKKFEKLDGYSIGATSELTLSIGYETRFGKWGVLADLGIYLYKPDFKKKTAYYEGIGLSYQINQNYKAIVRLKANKTVADFAEFGLGYTF